MNVADTEVAWAVLEGAGFTRAADVDTADVALMVTCAIREGAEQRVFNRLEAWHSVKRKRGRNRKASEKDDGFPLKVGVLGCMAERLKSRLLEGGHGVDLVCGPDAYRDLPRLLAHCLGSDQTAINVQLSLDETYADIAPVRLDPNSPSAFVSVMRGCDNMCTYCIVRRDLPNLLPFQSPLVQKSHDQSQDWNERVYAMHVSGP
jgi:tRNA A37 methylthiotransferase MiaB